MAKDNQQEMFGGQWTQDKLTCVKKYLEAYVKVFNRNPRAKYYKTHYVDAFAGTGYLKTESEPLLELFPDFSSDLLQQAEEYSKGSAVRALEVEPEFDHYRFIEKHADRAEQLSTLREQFPAKASKIEVETGEANTTIQRWVQKMDWKKNRAVVFLDPFGMQVDWTTIDALARTKAVDLWVWFPLFGVNRMLVRNGKIRAAWKEKLSKTFGTAAWEDEFYSVEKSTLLEGVEFVVKVADEKNIAEFYVKRLKSVFPAVVEPLILRNSRGRPLFMLCFAVANEKGAQLASKIAKDILGKQR